MSQGQTTPQLEMSRIAAEASPCQGEHLGAQYGGFLQRFTEIVRDEQRSSIALLVEHMGAEGYGSLAIAAAIRRVKP
jgi:hypothetical protein